MVAYFITLTFVGYADGSLGGLKNPIATFADAKIILPIKRYTFDKSRATNKSVQK